jgi:hypothetical protein
MCTNLYCHVYGVTVGGFGLVIGFIENLQVITTSTTTELPQEDTPWSLSLSKVKVKVILRPTVSLPVCPGVRPPSGPATNCSFLLEFSFRHLRVCYFVATLWREDGSVIYCCCWSSPEQSRSSLSPSGLNTIFYYPNSSDSPNLEGQEGPWTWWPRYTPTNSSCL